MATHVDTGALLLDQAEFYWQAHLLPRLEGLADEEYLWEPVPGCWSVRPGADGAWRMDTAENPPDPPPVTTIAWRLGHITECVHMRVSTFLEPDAPADGTMFDPWHKPAAVHATAGEAVAALERTVRRWHDGLAALGEEGMAAPLGPRGGWFADDPMVALLAHVNRETMHHGGEIGVLRDLYRASGGGILRA